MISSSVHRFRHISFNLTRYFHLKHPSCKTIPTNLKGKSKASQEWLMRQLNDPYVKKARELNYRARSAFKLIEIDERFKLLKPGMVVVECGAAPGAWSQVIVEKINSHGNDPDVSKGMLIGIDLLEIEPIPGALFFSNSDFMCPDVQRKVHSALIEFGASPTPTYKNGLMVDIVLSDMAPNASGILDLDQAKLCNLVDACITFAYSNGKVKSNFVAKVWEGSDLKSLENRLKGIYKSVHRVKPKSSRDKSGEIYLVGIRKEKSS